MEKQVARLIADAMQKLIAPQPDPQDEEPDEDDLGEESKGKGKKSGKGKKGGPKQNNHRPAKQRYKERMEKHRWKTMMQNCKNCWVGEGGIERCRDGAHIFF